MPSSSQSSPVTSETSPVFQMSMINIREMCKGPYELTYHEHRGNLICDLYKQYADKINKCTSMRESLRLDIACYNLANLFGNFAVICFKMGKVDEGKNAFKQAITWCITAKKYSTTPELELMLGTLHFGLGYFLQFSYSVENSSEIIENYKQALALFKSVGQRVSTPDYWRDLVMINSSLGNVLSHVNELEDGRACLFAALDVWVDKISARNKNDYHSISGIYSDLVKNPKMFNLKEGQLMLGLNQLVRSAFVTENHSYFDRNAFAKLYEEIKKNGTPIILHALKQFMVVIEKDYNMPEFPNRKVTNLMREVQLAPNFFSSLLHETLQKSPPIPDPKSSVETSKEKNNSANEELKKLKDELKMKEAAISAMAEEKKKRDEELKQINSKLKIVTQQLESLSVSQKLSGKRPERTLQTFFISSQESPSKAVKPNSDCHIRTALANQAQVPAFNLSEKRKQPELGLEHEETPSKLLKTASPTEAELIEQSEMRNQPK